MHLLTTEFRLAQWEQQLSSSEKDQILIVAEDEEEKIVFFCLFIHSLFVSAIKIWRKSRMAGLI